MTEGGRYRGRPVSWMAVVIILTGFTLGGLGLVVDRWWLFWAGVGVVVLGGILAIAIDIFADVELDHLHSDDTAAIEPAPTETASVAAAEQTADA